MLSQTSIEFPTAFGTFAVDRRSIDEQDKDKFIVIGLGNDYKCCKIVKLFLDDKTLAFYSLQKSEIDGSMCKCFVLNNN